MPLLGITIDTWAVQAYTKTMIATICIQSICFIVTLILLVIRIYHIYVNQNQLKINFKFALLHYSQLLMMIASLMYIFFHLWNYIHLFLRSNPMDCNLWMRSLILCLIMTRILVIVFLMLRSTISFEGTFCELPLLITVPVIFLSVIQGILLAIEIFMFSHGFNLIPNTGVCWRTIEQQGLIFGLLSYILNCVLSFAVLIIFYIKARSVRKEMRILTQNQELSMHSATLEREFNKHVKLGAITVVGTIIMFFFADILSVLLGIAFALDQVVNNILTFIMFKEHTNVYRCLFCKRVHETDNASNIIGLENVQTTSSDNTMTPTTHFSGTTGTTTTSITTVTAHTRVPIHTTNVTELQSITEMA